MTEQRISRSATRPRESHSLEFGEISPRAAIDRQIAENALPLDVAVVMPVYNEEACISAVVKEWLDALEAAHGRYRLVVLNDGSSDGTAAELEMFSSDPAVEAVHKVNTGHGPTVLVGYKHAVDIAEWVFQVDSDGEMSASHFARLWEQRHDYDALFGIRENREQDRGRRLISRVSRLTVRALFGRKVQDVNVPFRLLRGGVLRQILPYIPDDCFAPNVVIAGAIARSDLRVLNWPVPHQPRHRR